MKQTTRISLEKLFPVGDDYWRVDWVDGLVSKLEEREPQLRVFITKLRPNITGDVHPLNPSSLDRKHEVINIGVGHQNLIYIGSVWHQGRNVSSEFQYEKFNLSLDTSKAKTIGIKEKNENGKRLIPPYQYPIGPSFEFIKNSNLVALEHDKLADGVLIPLSEIIRFYYLLTSRISHAIYYGEFEDLIYSEPSFLSEGRVIQFTLNLGVSERNIVPIARYCASEYTRNSINEIHQWIMINSLNKEEVRTTKNFIPFKGDTKITCEGIRIRGDDNIQRILCTRLLTCTGEMGFNYIEYTKFIKSRPEMVSNPGTPEPPVVWPLYSSAPSDNLTIDSEPSNNHLAETYLNLEDRFPNLIKENILKISKKYDSSSDRIIISDVSDKIRDISTSKGTYGESETRKANIESDVLTNDSELPKRLIDFLNCLKHLRTLGWHVKTMKVDIPAENIIPNVHESIPSFEVYGECLLGLFETIPGKKKSWVQVYYGDQIRHRGIIIAEVRQEDHIWYLFDLAPDGRQKTDTEKGYSLLIRYPRNKKPLSNKDLYCFMSLTISNKGWPELKGNEAIAFKEDRLKHTATLKDRIVEALKKYMD